MMLFSNSSVFWRLEGDFLESRVEVEGRGRLRDREQGREKSYHEAHLVIPSLDLPPGPPRRHAAPPRAANPFPHIPAAILHRRVVAGPAEKCLTGKRLSPSAGRLSATHAGATISTTWTRTAIPQRVRRLLGAGAGEGRRSLPRWRERRDEARHER